MSKSAEAFRTISEVAEWLDTPTHVLRFWESKFSQLKPVKRAGGRRYYRPSDMELLSGIKKLLHEDGITIRGVQKILREQGVRHVCALSDREIDGYERPAPTSVPPQTPAQANTPAPDPDSERKVVEFRSGAPSPTRQQPQADEPSVDEGVSNIFAELEEDAPTPLLFDDLPQTDAKPEPLVLPSASPGYLSPALEIAGTLRRLSPDDLADKSLAYVGPLEEVRQLRRRLAQSLMKSQA